MTTTLLLVFGEFCCRTGATDGSQNSQSGNPVYVHSGSSFVFRHFLPVIGEEEWDGNLVGFSPGRSVTRDDVVAAGKRQRMI